MVASNSSTAWSCIFLLVVVSTARIASAWEPCTYTDPFKRYASSIGGHRAAVSERVSQLWASRLPKFSLDNSKHRRNTGLECQSFTSRLFPSNATSPQITHRIFRATFPQATRQLWLIAGGPGDSAAASFHAILNFFSTTFEADVYIVDVRGVGLSDQQFWCETEAGRGSLSPFIEQLHPRFASCYSEIAQTFGSEGMASFRTSNFAYDLRQAIANVAASTTTPQKVWLLGYSYGTYVVNRFLTMYPDVAYGIVLDGVMFGTGPSDYTATYDYHHNKIFDRIMQLCREDPFCRSKIDSDDFARNVMINLRNGSCPVVSDIIAPSTFANMLLFSFLDVNNPALQQLLPMIFFRLNRCSNADQAFLSDLASKMFENLTPQPEAEPAPLISSIYQFVFVASNELSNLNAPKASILAPLRDMSLNLTGISASSFFGFRDVVPRYTEPLREQTFGNSTQLQRVLFVSGELDPRTPAEWSASLINQVNPVTSNSNTKIRVVVPRGSHTNVNFGVRCAWKLAIAFIKENDTAVAQQRASEECTTAEPLDFRNATGVHEIPFFGSLVLDIENLWNDTLDIPPQAPPQRAPVAPPTPMQERAPFVAPTPTPVGAAPIPTTVAGNPPIIVSGTEQTVEATAHMTTLLFILIILIL